MSNKVGGCVGVESEEQNEQRTWILNCTGPVFPNKRKIGTCKVLLILQLVLTDAKVTKSITFVTLKIQLHLERIKV